MIERGGGHDPEGRGPATLTTFHGQVVSPSSLAAAPVIAPAQPSVSPLDRKHVVGQICLLWSSPAGLPRLGVCHRAARDGRRQGGKGKGDGDMKGAEGRVEIEV